jgi:pantoate--beta-alanine ligase
MQFGPAEDLARYPRDFGRDRALCEAAGVDIIFFPDAKSVYPEGYQTVIRVTEAEKGLCGAFRPTHFSGVATVVAKLFNMVKPHEAFFGEKDYQQLAVIKRMVADLDMDLKITGVATVKDPDGLAMSSRNVYLSAEERRRALVLPRALDEAGRRYREGVRSAAALEKAALKVLATEKGVEVQYVEARGPGLEKVGTLGGHAVIAAAVKVGATRLIDNRILGRRR